MITQSQPVGITIPITTEFKRLSQHFSQRCEFANKAEQIRQNTLAVCVVNAYLQLLNIPTNVADSDSWNPMMQVMSNVADLTLPEVGTLSCRVLEPDAQTCHIPPEDWHDRAGYIAVRLDETANQAELVGFLAAAPNSDTVSLERFGPIETLIDRVHELRLASTPGVVTSQVRSELTQLSNWISDVATPLQAGIAAGWQAVDSLINPAELSFAFRGSEVTDPAFTTNVSRAKLIDLGLQLSQPSGEPSGQPSEQVSQVALVVHVTPNKQNGEQNGEQARKDIVLQVRPLGESPYLNAGLTLQVLDGNDQPFMSATSRAIDNYIQLHLSGDPGEQFSVQITMGKASFNEQFVI